MVGTNDVLLLGGALLGILYLKKRDNQISNIRGNAENYNVIQEINLDNITQSKSRIEQLTDIRSQIIGYERSVLDQKVSLLKAEIGKAQALGSQYQAIAARPNTLTRTAADTYQRLGSLEGAFQLLSQGDPKQQLQARSLKLAIERKQALERIKPIQEFIDKTNSVIDELNAKQSELEQIV